MSRIANLPKWLYNEFQCSGVDYEAVEVARQFDKRHESFRDYDAEFALIRERTGLRPEDVVLDLGCGTGAFVVPAAKFCRKVYGIDPAEPMLTILREKLSARKIENVELFREGFLTYRHDGEPIDVAISSIALHHLPDFWKAIALQNVSDALKPGGVFYLFDVVFHFPISEWREGTQLVLDKMSEAAGREANAHISSEFSAFDWVIEGILERVGLRVEKVFDDSVFLRAYVCRKVETSAPAKNSPILTPEQVRSVDSRAVERWKIPSVLLMENAGRSVAEIFLTNAPKLNGCVAPKRVLICCGKGNNGGDGFVLARRLELLGLDCRVALVQAVDKYVGDARTNLDVLQAAGQNDPEKLFVFDDSEASRQRFARETASCDWIVDALLGTGAKGALRSPYDKLVSLINNSNKPVCAIDVPSGLNPSDGSVSSDAVRAKMTATLAANKTGLALESAKDYVGELFVGDIGVPVEPFLEDL
ncbi:MAG: NAD(P)H-hydrate epimerase [Thermoguttaceae bacterium]|nr:NAD(P)H-hydrate epimerase [Thermoguttaceae bacterium]